MADLFDFAVQAPNDYSTAGPALLSVGDTPVIAWRATGEPWPVIMPIARRADGSIYFDESRKRVVDQAYVGGGIALGQAPEPFRRSAAVMWAADHEPASLYGNIIDSDLTTVGDLVALGQASQDAPALCLWVKELFMAWTGNDQRLNVAPMGFSDSGWEFLFERKWTSSETSEWAPSLAWRPAPNRLYIAWTGEGDHNLNYMYCEGGAWADPPPHIPVFPSSTKRTLDAETSDAGPSIWISGSTIQLAYRGSGNNNINLLRTDADTGEIYSKQTSGHLTPHQPDFATFWDDKWVAYTGEDEHLYLAHIAGS